ncbi:carcinoembryonic antigen-related cell adhesion molecule 1-like isoform X2 [Dendropsophus ebraccatus]|uniref:carcinoembryonic antigen-related cell adhesion molecule 1-like isoform X2 n=1 Tax=Dendropsophus ebraccatus TaxID=150705 RepID=UPI00383204F7
MGQTKKLSKEHPWEWHGGPANVLEAAVTSEEIDYITGGTGAVTANTLVNGALGGSVHFDVSVPSQANGLISWSFKSFPAALLNSGSSPQYFSVCIGRCTMYGNGSLTLTNLTSSNEGTYTITAYTSAGDVLLTDTFDLRVYANLTGPVLRYATGTSNPPISGTSATLWCDARSQTVTTYTFSRDQKTICSGSQPPCRGQYLDFTPITESDSGSYTCTIQNPVSSATSNFLTLTVYAPVSNVSVTSSVSGLVWPGLESVSLRCSAHGTNVSYLWSVRGAAISGGNQYHLSDNNTLLTISPVYPTENGPFICTAKNVINSQNSSDVYLTLASPVSGPVTVTSNTSGVLWAGEDSVSFYCTAQGSAITFSWDINGKPVSSIPPYYITQSDSPPHSNLTISPVSKDIAHLSCTASNRANSVSSMVVILTVYSSPNGNIRCSARHVLQILELGCFWSRGKPAANVTMIFNDTESVKRSDQVFTTVTSLKNVQGNNLTCNGEQLGRTSSCVLLFDLPRSPTTTNGSTTSVAENDTVVLTVDLTSETSPVLPALFSWYCSGNSTPIRNDSTFTVITLDYITTLQINNVSKSGKYECVANNFFGSTTFLFNVEVSKKVSPRLDGGQIAGIVIGVLAGVVIIGVIVFFALKKRNTKEAVYENADHPPANTYETKLPAMVDTSPNGKEESHYQQLIHPNESVYHTVIPGAGK